ncbi:geranylgeranyl reductase family protein [Streptomyces sp. RFCAC02]|uniref:geranylgeranyl reductase family protein n=1 Tax=Streptomyces sp. RFCAC02 TaxID=2499143 RepID=UPI001F0F0FB2|nr:geranylgeranyl reductase family protein [Streptomyces sp. RFCAC02]
MVVGAGPAGSSAAYHLARHGVDVLLLEKSEFPRDKVCGDGLTPRAVRQLIRMGIDTAGEGWHRNKGVRFFSDRAHLEIDWPENTSYPGYGLTRTRHDFDDILARQAVRAGARLWTGARVTDPVVDRTGRVSGVHVLIGPDKRQVTCTAPVVIAADGVSARLALALGVERDPARPMATAVRRYYRSPAKQADPYLDIFSDLRTRPGAPALPGYGWVFPMGDGRVNVGLGLITTPSTEGGDLRRLLGTWLTGTPAAWGLRDEANAEGPIRGAALPMGHNRRPHYTRGLLLTGDSGGMVSPWNGEGIPYAMESGELAAEIVSDAFARRDPAWRERVLRQYPREIQRRDGRYYRLGTAWAAMLTRPAAASFVSRQVMRSPAAMRTLLRLLTNLTDERGGDMVDRLLATAIRVVPVRRPRGPVPPAPPKARSPH